jgi:uncharacterized protein
MQLSTAFYIDRPVDVVWEALCDLERVAECVPGFSLQEVAPDSCTGTIKVKVGAISMSYRGTLEFQERDDDGRRAVMRASGRELRGQGTVEATVTSAVLPDGSRTNVNMVTDLAVTGRVAQFGRGILGDVADRLAAQFAACLESKLVADEPAASSAPNGESRSAPGAPLQHGPSREESPPLDLTGTIARPLARRAVLVALGLAAGIVILRRARR